MLLPERLRQILEYDPSTGLWTWLDPPNHNTRLTGQIAGSVRDDGYRRIRLDGTLYYASRLAFLYMVGEWPKEEVDHIDRNPANDRWDNLREATSTQNKFNSEGKGGLLHGVNPCGRKWQVSAGRYGYLGVYDTLEEAIQVRAAALERHVT